MSDGNGAKPAETPVDLILEVEDREDDAEPLTESATGGPDAPWAPLPTWVARRMRQERPETACEFIFPTVFEENRSEKIADLGAARQEGWITHRRAAEQGVKELGFDAYDYDEEQNAIVKEKKAGVGAPQLGQGDVLARSLGAPGGSSPNGAPSGPPVTRRRDTPGEPVRADLSDPAVADFKRAMRQAEAQFHAAAGELRRLREAMAAAPAEDRARLVEGVVRLTEQVTALAGRLGTPAPPPDIHVDVQAPHIEVQAPHVDVQAPHVEVQPTIHVPAQPAPQVTVHVDAPAPPGPVRFERDPKTGAIIRSVPEPPAE